MKFDQKGVSKLLKHRHPFLFVTGVDILSDTTITGTFDLKKVDHHFFDGHFPGDPIMPGVLLIEALSQVAGILTFKPLLDRGILTLEGLRSYVYLVRVNDFVIKDKILPDCTITIDSEVTSLPSPYFFEAKGKVSVDGQCKAIGSLVLYSRVEN
ncbi:beta-hydroxyacyl-ACP dehydratase [bacterium]|nr:beta-hydroxyacyl-ACP dehydratase [bacterium]